MVTFIFDVVLAYEITEKIYDLKAADSFNELPKYNFALAFQSISFWLIILAGFVVYIIWGMVFDFTMEAYDNLGEIKQKIKAKEFQLEALDEELDNQKNNIEKIEKENSEIKKRKIRLENEINGKIIDLEEYKPNLHAFNNGWLEWMHANKIDKEIIDNAHNAFNDFMEEYNKH